MHWSQCARPSIKSLSRYVTHSRLAFTLCGQYCCIIITVIYNTYALDQHKGIKIDCLNVTKLLLKGLHLFGSVSCVFCFLIVSVRFKMTGVSRLISFHSDTPAPVESEAAPEADVLLFPPTRRSYHHDCDASLELTSVLSPKHQFSATCLRKLKMAIICKQMILFTTAAKYGKHNL